MTLSTLDRQKLHLLTNPVKTRVTTNNRYWESKKGGGGTSMKPAVTRAYPGQDAHTLCINVPNSSSLTPIYRLIARSLYLLHTLP